MANGDVYKASVISEQQGVAMANDFHFRANADAAPGQELDAILNFLENDIVPAMAEFTSNIVQFTCIGAQRITGVTTSTKTQFISEPGAVLADALPTTTYVKMRAYTIPYQTRQSLGNKFSGIPEDGTKQGQLSLAAVLRYANLINILLTNPITTGGNSYNWCSPRLYDGLDPLFPSIRKANIVPCVYNIKSRQTNLCGS